MSGCTGPQRVVVPKAGITTAANNEVVVQPHANGAAGLVHRKGDRSIGAAHPGVTRGVVVNQQHSGCVQQYGLSRNLPWIARHFVEGACGEDLVPDQGMRAVEKDSPHLLHPEKRHLQLEIINQLTPLLKYRPGLEFAFCRMAHHLAKLAQMMCRRKMVIQQRFGGSYVRRQDT